MIRVRNLQIIKSCILIATILLLARCGPEIKVGTEFLAKRKGITLVIRAPRWVKMVNTGSDTVKNGAEYSQRERDSINFYNTKVLQDIKDSIVIGNYIKNLRQELERQGYKTLLVGSQDSLFPVKGEAFLINIGQIELDEQNMPIRDETQYRGKLHYADYDIIKMEMDFWIDVNRIVDSVAVQPSKLLYDSFNDTDNFSGFFEWDLTNKKMNYRLNSVDITPEFIYSTASEKGIEHADRLNIYLLNEYIAFHFPQSQNLPLFGVNPQFGTLERIYSPPFKVLQ